jgi:hypothetical protein
MYVCDYCVSVLERGWHAAHQSVACESTRHLYSHKGTWLCDTSIVSRWQAEHTVSAKLDLLGMVPALRCAPGTVLRVCWVAVPKAMRARRANRRGTSSGCGGLRGCASAAMRSGGAGGAAGHLCRAHREDGRRRGRDFGSVRRERSWAACEGEGQVFRHSMMYWASVPLQQDCRRSDDLLAESL